MLVSILSTVFSSNYFNLTLFFTHLARPGMLDFKGKAKWDSWESKKGMSSDAAKEAYVVKAEEIVAKYSA